MGSAQTKGGYTYHNGIPVIEEDNAIDQIRREKHQEQKERLSKFKRERPPSSPNAEVRKFYGNRENFEDLQDAVGEVVAKFAPEQENDVELILRRYRGMEVKLYEKFDHLYSRHEDYESVDFDLNRLPHKGNFELHHKQVNAFAQWMSRASARIVMVQSRVRQFLAKKQLEKDKAAGTGAYAKRMVKPQDDDAGSVASTDSKEDKKALAAADADTLTKVAFPADEATVAAPKPQKSSKSTRRRSRRSKKESKTAKREPEMAHIVVSQRIQEALDRTQVSAELLFFMHDEKNTGRIDMKHFMQLCRQDLHIARTALSDKQLSDVFKAIDTSHDGELQLEELESYLEQHTKLAKDAV